jgi:hypothetical protein
MGDDVLAVGFDDFARHRAERGVRHDVVEVVVGRLEADAQRAVVYGRQAVDLLVIIVLAALLRLCGEFVEADDLAFEEELPGRAQLRVHEALEAVDEIAGDEFARLALEGRVWREMDALF